MKKIVKYITSAVVAVWLFCITAISAFAYTEGYFRYEVTDGVITITEYFGREKNVTVPDLIAGTPVSIIGENVFPDGCGVKTVNLPDSIMKVYENSFGDGVKVVYATKSQQTTTTAPVTAKPSVTEPGVSENTGGGSYVIPSASVTDIDEGGMEESEENIDSKPAVTDIPEYVEVAPAEDTAKTSSSEPVAETTNQPAETTVSPAVNDDGQPVSAEENGSKSVIDRNKGYTTSTDAQGNTVILDDKGKQVNADDIVTSAVESAESKQKKSNVLPIVLVVSAFAVAAAVVIIILKRKK